MSALTAALMTGDPVVITPAGGEPARIRALAGHTGTLIRIATGE